MTETVTDRHTHTGEFIIIMSMHSIGHTITISKNATYLASWGSTTTSSRLIETSIINKVSTENVADYFDSMTFICNYIHAGI